jgi:hypothetical protein
MMVALRRYHHFVLLLIASVDVQVLQRYHHHRGYHQRRRYHKNMRRYWASEMG